MKMNVWELQKWLDPEGLYKEGETSEMIHSPVFIERNSKLQSAKCLKCGHFARGEHMTFLLGSEGKCIRCPCREMEVEVEDFLLDVVEMRKREIK